MTETIMQFQKIELYAQNTNVNKVESRYNEPRINILM